MNRLTFPASTLDFNNPLLKAGEEFSMTSGADPKVQEMIMELSRKPYPSMSEVLEGGMASGEFYRENVENLTLMLYSMLGGMSVMCVIEHPEQDIVRLYEDAIRIFLRGLPRHILCRNTNTTRVRTKASFASSVPFFYSSGLCSRAAILAPSPQPNTSSPLPRCRSSRRRRAPDRTAHSRDALPPPRSCARDPIAAGRCSRLPQARA